MKYMSELEEQRIPGLDTLLEWLCSSSCDFYVAPASTKFHGSCTGGLLEHSLCVCTCLQEICKTFDTDNKISRRAILVSSLFHDICKVNLYKPVVKYRKDSQGKWESYDSYEYQDIFPVGHGEKSVIMLQQFIKLTAEEILAIRYHMGAYGEANMNGLSAAQEKYPLVVYLHMADMIASKIYNT